MPSAAFWELWKSCHPRPNHAIRDHAIRDYGRQGRFCGPEGGQAAAKPPARDRILG
jgi:hypothetical protein